MSTVNVKQESSERFPTEQLQVELNEDEYDDCKGIGDYVESPRRHNTKSSTQREPNTTSNRSHLRNKSNQISTQHESQMASNSFDKDEAGGKFSRVPSSPMKRNHVQSSSSAVGSSRHEESPSKRIRMPAPAAVKVEPVSHQLRANVKALDLIRNGGRDSSPKRTRSSSTSSYQSTTRDSDAAPKKSFASTPKSERRVNAFSQQARDQRVKELAEQSSAAIERNLSSNWADILDELEEQSKELTEYMKKVSEKYKIDADKLAKGVECDAETLRKRQKRINYGKVTDVYKRYAAEIPRKKRDTFHPRTPNKFRKCSRRKFDGLVKKWRKLLHVWNESPDILPDFKMRMDKEEEEEEDEDMTDDFGGASNITASNFSYNVDDYDIVDDDERHSHSNTSRNSSVDSTNKKKNYAPAQAH